MPGRRILAIHDLSSHGNASLGIVVPALTAQGHTVITLPTVLLSSTTDLDPDPVALDTTKWMKDTFKRWTEHNVQFDAIYTGWLGHPEQVALLCDFFEAQRRKGPVTIFVDPVLGDQGELYPAQVRLAELMPQLVGLADVMLPNPTEAAILVDRDPQRCGIESDGTVSVNDALSLLASLTRHFPRTFSILTSVAGLGSIGVEANCMPEHLLGLEMPLARGFYAKRTLHTIGGTGDLFASILIGLWLHSGVKQDGRMDTIIKQAVVTMADIMSSVAAHEATPGAMPITLIQSAMQHLR